jgi:hypothetical protein
MDIDCYTCPAHLDGCDAIGEELLIKVEAGHMNSLLAFDVV